MSHREREEEAGQRAVTASAPVRPSCTGHNTEQPDCVEMFAQGDVCSRARKLPLTRMLTLERTGDK